MKLTLLSAAIASLFLSGAATAATLDFIKFSDNNEQGVTSGTAITDAAFDGEKITFSANNNWYPYFDHGGAGLGVCKTVNDPGATANNGTTNQCNSGAGDDNVTMTEAVTISWSGARTLSNLLFTGEWHNKNSPEFLHLEPAGTGNKQRSDNTLLFAINGNQLARYTFSGLHAASLANNFTGATSATFAFDDTTFNPILTNGLARDAEQYYLASATLSSGGGVTPVPLPAALPMLLAALGGLGLITRRRKTV